MLAYLWISLQIIEQNIDTDGQVSCVEGIGSIPALRTKFSPLDHNRMEVNQRKQDTLKLILSCTHI